MITSEQRAALYQCETALIDTLQQACSDFIEHCKAAHVPQKEASAALTFRMAQGLPFMIVSATNIDGKLAGSMLSRMVDAIRGENTEGETLH
jgi:hypothetical protein